MFVATMNADSEEQSLQSSTCYAVQVLQLGGLEDHTAEPTKQTTSGSQPINVEETCQSSSEPTESQRDQPALKTEERPIAAPMLGDIKMKIKIPYDYK